MHPNLQLVLKRERIEVWGNTQKGVAKKRPNVFFKCYVCSQIFPRKGVAIDHINPVGPTPGSRYDKVGITWDTFIQRLFCPVENLGIICETCHAAKTAKEREARSKEYQSAG